MSLGWKMLKKNIYNRINEFPGYEQSEFVAIIFGKINYRSYVSRRYFIETWKVHVLFWFCGNSLTWVTAPVRFRGYLVVPSSERSRSCCLQSHKLSQRDFMSDFRTIFALREIVQLDLDYVAWG